MATQLLILASFMCIIFTGSAGRMDQAVKNSRDESQTHIPTSLATGMQIEATMSELEELGYTILDDSTSSETGRTLVLVKSVPISLFVEEKRHIVIEVADGLVESYELTNGFVGL